MVHAKIDGKGRVIIPKIIREQIMLNPEQKINIFVKDENHLVIERLSPKSGKKEDSLDLLLKNPAHIDPKLATKEKLEEIEEEMWKP